MILSLLTVANFGLAWALWYLLPKWGFSEKATFWIALSLFWLIALFGGFLLPKSWREF